MPMTNSCNENPVIFGYSINDQLRLEGVNSNGRLNFNSLTRNMGGGITQGRRRLSSDARVGYRIPDLSYCGRRTMPAVKRLTHVPPAVVPPPPMREAQVRGNELDSDRCASRATAHNAGDLVGERNRDKLEGLLRQQASRPVRQERVIAPSSSAKAA